MSFAIKKRIQIKVCKVFDCVDFYSGRSISLKKEKLPGKTDV